MLQRVARSCLPIALSAGLIASAGATAAPVAAATPTSTVTIVLKAHHLAELRNLAAARGLSHAQRVRKVQRLLPSRAQHATVVRALRAAGLQITNQTAWSVTASGSSAEVTSTFGSRPVLRAHATAAQRRAATRPYPSLPASLRDAAAVALPTGSGPTMFRHYTTPDFFTGADFRNAYTSVGQTPYDGSGAGATLTIATIQLAAWNPGDLTTWAGTSGIGVAGFDPATDLTMVPVDQTSVPVPDGDDDGDVEVDLDQQALLSTAPFAHQRPYFAPNDSSGYVDALSQVLDDVTQSSHAFGGGDPHIVALSTSWGLCELDTGAAIINAMEPVLASLVAAGVTVFAASGDDGIYDQCSAAGAHADYPASSPEVVGVGGTSLSPVTTSAPNDGTNWLEPAWSCTGVDDCADSGGSGGGVSGDEVNVGFDKPAYQQVIETPPFSQATKRMVPDIAAYADPDPGFPFYTTDPKSGTGYSVGGGTSLAAPVSAALFTNALAAHGVSSGVGDIHSALYAAYAANDGSFRDVTVGSNGAAADAGRVPSVDAGPGYDTVTGLGAPLWPKIVNRLLSPLAAPIATAALSLASPHASRPYRVSASWTGSPANGGLAVDKAAVRISRVGHAGAVFDDQNAEPNGAHTFTALPGATYRLSVTARDLAGTRSITKTSTLVIPIDDKRFDFVGSWRRKTNGRAFAGSFAQTSERGAAASVKASGRRYALLARTGPGYGKLTVSKSGRTVKVINLHARRAGAKRVTFFRSGSAGSRRFEFFASRGLVDVDALYVER